MPPCPYEELDQLVAQRLDQRLADASGMAMGQILKMLSGIHIAWAIKDGMEHILYKPVTAIICVKGVHYPAAAHLRLDFQDFAPLAELQLWMLGDSLLHSREHALPGLRTAVAEVG